MPVLSVTSKFGWLPRARSYEEERAALERTATPVDADHLPLQEHEEKAADPEEEAPSTQATLTESSSVVDPLSGDPLSAAAQLQAFQPLVHAEENPLVSTAGEGTYDPLTQAVVEEEEDPGVHLRRLANEGFVPWTAKKSSILKKYTTNERVTINVNFMESEGAQGPTDTVRDRLEELEESENPDKKTIAITQQEYLTKIENMHTELLEAWNNNQRVLALKIVIQCSKLLSDTSVIKFYPSKFVLITEILDTFGRLVFDRLRGRSVIYDSINAVPVPLPEDFKAEDVTPTARETCRNWFFKIASIRELIPRLYVEMALVNSYRFLANDTFVAIVSRMTAMLKGIGDPLVATYARAYLARKGREVGVYSSDYVLSMFFDHIDTHVGLNKVQEGKKVAKMPQIAKKAGVDMPSYLDLYTPGLQWLLQCIGHSAENDTLDVVLRKYKQADNPLVLDHILEAFKPSVIAPRALELSILIGKADTEIFPKYRLYRTLGMNLVLCAPPASKRLAVMNEIWKVVAELPNVEEYMAVVEVFIEFPSRYCGAKEVNAMLGDVLEHVKKDHIYENFQNEIESILMKVLSHQQNFLAIFSMKNFMPLVDLLFGDVQVGVNKAMLVSFCKNPQPTTDPVLINAMFEVGKVVHDSINSLSFADDIRQIASLIAIFIQKINYGMDLEKQLNFYVDCRRAFGNLDSVKRSLVLVGAGLAMKTHKIVKGQHTKRTAAFVRACIAFCFITTPSMDDYFERLHLYLVSAQAALVNRCIPQAEALFDAAVDLLEELPSVHEVDKQVLSTERPLVQFMGSFCSLLIAVPGHPEHGPFHRIRRILEIMDTHKWERISIAQSRVHLKIIALLSTLVQNELPYHIAGIESNDTLYAGDTDYKQEAQELIDGLIQKVMDNLQSLQTTPDASAKKNRAVLAMQFLNVTLAHAELNESVGKLVVNLHKIASASNTVALKNCVRHLGTKQGLGEKLSEHLR